MCTRPDADSLTFMMSEKLLKERKLALFCTALFLQSLQTSVVHLLATSWRCYCMSTLSLVSAMVRGDTLVQSLLSWHALERSLQAHGCKLICVLGKW